MKMNKPIEISGQTILPGERKKIYLDVAALFDYTKLSIPLEVICGKEAGPTMFISAAIHGDEINGVEILGRLLHKPILKKLKGTLIVVPVVNIFGFNSMSRYLPDRRDLNRVFPGSKDGSLGAQIAHIFMKEVVSKCTHGIDLHTGAIHRANLPQIRACLDDPATNELAKGFGVPVIIHSKLRDGSLREAARKKKVITLLFEGGEALRFDENVIVIGLKGCLAVMSKIGMLPEIGKQTTSSNRKRVYTAKESYWVRAPHSGTFIAKKKLGDRAEAGETLALISDPFGGEIYKVVAQESGVVIGLSTLPLVNKGAAMFHIASFNNSKKVKEAIELMDDSTAN